MPRRRQSLDESAIANDILAVLETYAKDSQFYPTQGGLHSQMKRMGYRYTIGRFNYWFARLVQDGRIEVDWRNTRAIRAVNLIIIDREFSQFP